MTLTADNRASQMYALYQDGYSLSQVAGMFGVTRQSVFGLFKTRRWPMRPKPMPLPPVEFNGAKYTVRNTGYYGRTDDRRTLLHRDVWELHNGPIPRGWDIHHKDGDRANNDITNLELLPKAEHTRLYSPHNNQYTRGRKRVARSC